jgi:hypothetical protein
LAALAGRAARADNERVRFVGAEKNSLHRRLATYVSAAVLAALLGGAVAAWAKESAKPPQRARPPKWSPDVLDAFFPDARTKLVGGRPDYEKANAANVAASGPAAAASDGARAAAGGDEGAWSKLIDAETVETEIKRIAQEVAKSVTAPAQFKGGGYKDCRREFTVLAAMFGVAGEYDGDVRWKESAPLLRDVFARAGRNCKVGSDQTFQEANLRKQNLADLIGGTRPKASNAERKADWPQVADRPPLMQRMNIGQQDRLQKWLASKGEFNAHRDDAKHEAQLLAAIAEIISRPGYEFADDDTYVGYARDLKQASTDVAAAIDQNNYEQARQAAGRASKARADCHEGYRQ